MARKATSSIIKEYERQLPLHISFTEKVKELVSDLLKENDLRVHSITSRVKEREPLRDKLERGEARYCQLADITDICGIRVITYFADGVDAVAKVIEDEFEIDDAQSVDKRALLDPDRFGYLSLHYVAKLSPSRLTHTENRRFGECVFEVQIRSILQHTWAEIEHDLGYKSKQAVPQEARRRFSRLAGLLELADSEFAAIRDGLSEYVTLVPERIEITPETVSIDQDSLEAFVKSSTLVRELDQKIVAASDSEIGDKPLDRSRHLHYVGLTTIADVESALRANADLITRFAKVWITRLGRRSEKFPPGISLFYLSYVLIAQIGSIEKIEDYLSNVRISTDDKKRQVARDVTKAFKNISSKKA